jgi:hypothetical protein
VSDAVGCEGQRDMRRSSVDLVWIPLGAGDNTGLVRRSGRLFEALAARHERRRPVDIYHSALQVQLDAVPYAVEMTPAWGLPQDVDRGVMVTGPVAFPELGRSPLFSYEVHAWRNGSIPDIAEAVGTPQRLSCDRGRAQSVLDLLSAFPTRTWGRDEQATGDMWNSNSLISWALVRSGHDITEIRFPENGRAPGWTAGLTVARRELRGRCNDVGEGHQTSTVAVSPSADELAPALPEGEAP